MSAISRITVDPARCGGRPCVRDLRVRVKDVLELLAVTAVDAQLPLSVRVE